jgi:aryl-alcohol dehydrogenase-like predicted oxidoreductase
MTVSLAGLGTGGRNAFGQHRGADAADGGRLVRRALDLGIDLFDTAPAYGGSEALLGEALAGVPRSAYRVTSKVSYRDPAGALLAPADIDASIRTSLGRLRVTELDVLLVHALKPADYDAVVDRHLPVLIRARESGLVRAIGISESFAGDDPGHETLDRAVEDGRIDVVMVGYNVLHQTAERHVLPVAAANGIGVIVMAAVRNVLGSPAALAALVGELTADGRLAPDALPETDPLGWLVHGDVVSVPAACYRFVAAHPAVSCVLTGTFDPDHLAENATALDAGPLPAADEARLRRTFGHLDLGLGR